MAAIKRELKVKFSTTGDGEVVRSIVKVDDSLKGTAQTGQQAAASVGDLSEKLDKDLENSVGRAFKVTDRLNSIVGQVTGALGLAGIAIGGVVTVYKALTAGSDRAARTQKLVAENLKRVADKAAEAAKQVNALAAAQGGQAGFLSGPELVQLQDAEKRRNALLKEREQLTARQLATEAKLAKMTGGLRAQTVSDLSNQRRALEERLDNTQFEISLLQQVAAKRRNDALAIAGPGPTSIKGALDATAPSFGIVTEATRALTEATNELAQAAGAQLSAAYADTLPGLADAFEGVEGKTLADRLGFSPTSEAEILQAAEAMGLAIDKAITMSIPKLKRLLDDLAKIPTASEAAREAAKSFGASAAGAFGQAGAAALVYGQSFSEVAAQAIAGLAAQATTEALFQTAKGLAYLASGFFTGSPKDIAASKAAFGSAAAFGAIAAVTVPAARATGSASGAGGGLPSGPSARDAGIDRPGGAGGGEASTIIINTGSPISTAADIGAEVARGLNAAGRSRGRVRVNQRALRRG